MIPSLIDPVAQTVAGGPVTMERGIPMLHRLLDAASRLELADRELPYGRYLIHADPKGLFNLQLDVFSRGYVGGIHAHRTWGLFFILRGALYVDDYNEVDGTVVHARSAFMGTGGGQFFCPPHADWHRVATRPDGPQVVSVHIYGEGFDMDVGEALNGEGQVRSYRRGAFGDPKHLENFWSYR